MTQELIGLEFLQKNEIKNKRCNMEQPFAFISYSHDDFDSQIVMNVFKLLYDKGINVWIDTANMPYGEDDWKVSAMQALMNHNCKFAFFFRSESSMLKDTISKELTTIKKLKHIGPIVTIDIWHEKGIYAQKFLDQVLNGGDYSVYAVCEQICNIVSPECKALRLSADFGNDIHKLAAEMIAEAKEHGLGGGKQVEKPEPPKPEPPKQEPPKPESPKPAGDGYTYTIFGKPYKAGEREQGKLMYDAFAALMERYPDSVDQLTRRTSVARAEDVKNANTKDADPVYFRGCKSFQADGREYLVGTSYGFNAKLAEIKGMFKICGADVGEFILNGKPLVDKNPGDGTGAADGFAYDLWNIPHKAKSMADMMHDVFDLIAEKYPASIPEMAENQSITSVAHKSDVDEGKLPPNKLNYFQVKKEHTVDGAKYYVSTRYNREQGLGQLKKMLVLCEGNADALKITAVPDKTTHSVSGKKGIGELLR